MQLTLARVRLFFREPSSVFWAFGFPIVLTVVLGIAFRNRPPAPIEVAVEQGPYATATQAALAQSRDLKATIMGASEARAALRIGRVTLVVVAGQTPAFVFDPTRQESRLAKALVDDALQRAAGRKDATVSVDRPVTETGSRYIDFLVPGLVGLNIMSSGMWGIGYSIVEDRKARLLKRMLATPMRRSHFLLSFVLMRLLFLVLELPLLLGFGHFVFGVGVRGSLPLLVGIAVLGALAFSGLGLLVASRAQNTSTVSGLMNLVMLPMYVGSGVFFAWTNFPEAVQPLLRLLPLTALNDGMRSIMNEGVGALAVAPQASVLAVTAAVSFAVALRFFRWS
jgi:ABC-2 type transport system permease protein